MNAAEIIAEINALPEIPTVRARDMYAAQGVKLTAADQWAIETRRTFFVKHGLRPVVSLQVVDFDNVKIGTLDFHA